MTIAIETENPQDSEQIYSSQTGLNVLESIRKVLQRDKFNLFNLKANFEFDQKIDQSEKDIDKLIRLRSQGADQTAKLNDELKQLKLKNQKCLQHIGGLLDAH